MLNIKEEIEQCHKCGILPKQTEIFIQEGKTPFIIIGESPAKDGWIVSKRAFFNSQGKLQASGRVLSKLLDILNLNIEDIYFTECCKCIIENRNMLDKCSENCKSILIKQLNILKCNLIITMGKSPTQALLNKKIDKFSNYVGNIYHIKLGKCEYNLLPIYHTSPLNPKGYKDNVPIFEKLKDMLK